MSGRGVADRASDALVTAGAVGLVAMTLVIGWQVFGRFVLDSSPSWSEAAALVLMIWYVFLAAAAGVWERFHIRIEILEHRLDPARVRTLRIVLHALVALMSVAILVYGAQLAWLVRVHVIPGLGISRAFAYLPIPVAGLLMTLFSLNRIRLRWREAR